MLYNRRTCALSIVCLSLAAASSTLAGDDHGHGHAGDFIVGKDGSDQIEIEFDFDESLPLGPIDGPLLFGCVNDEPGFLSLDEDEPDEGFFVLPGGASIVFEIVSISVGLKVHTPGFGAVLDSPGAQFVLGSPPFDVHPTFHIDENDPAFDPDAEFSLTLRLLDANGLCNPSDEYVVMFRCATPGACCFADGDCEDGEFEEECEDEGGAFLGEGTVCSPGGCVTGACCFPEGDCHDGELAVECADEGGEFLGDDSGCSPGVCQVGACCLNDQQCQSLRGFECSGQAGDFAGPGTDCGSISCGEVFEPIPTTSEWGLVILGLGLAISAKLGFARLRIAA